MVINYIDKLLVLTQFVLIDCLLLPLQCLLIHILKTTTFLRIYVSALEVATCSRVLASL